MAAVRAFLHLLSQAPDTADEIFQSIRDPLYTLLGEAVELRYTILENIRAICVRYAHAFANEYKLFFIRYVS